MGKRTSGKRAVHGIGRASPIHQDAIRMATAAVRWASMDIPDGVGASRTMKNKKSPNQKGILERELFKSFKTCMLYFKPAKAAAFWVSTLTAGPMVEVKAMFLRYTPLEEDGLALTTASRRTFRFSTIFSDPKLTLPMGQ